MNDGGQAEGKIEQKGCMVRRVKELDELSDTSWLVGNRPAKSARAEPRPRHCVTEMSVAGQKLA